ncbi:MAG: GAF domain-containing protein, partial [Calditrichaeota bacterium]|nr:GAF domain-containing protein [Calditrichota bacterium]
MTSPENTDALDRLRQENRRLQRSVLELSVLNDVATAIGSTMALDKIIELIIEKCVKHFRVEQGAVLLLDERQDQVSFRTMVRKLDTTGYRRPYRLDTELSGWMLKHRRPLVVNDFASDGRFSGGRDAPFEIRSLLAAPLLLKSKMIGLICLFNKKLSEGFTPDDQRLLSILAVESAQVIENARLYQEEQELRRVQEELRVASDIQRGLLPKAFPEIEGYDIAAVNLPARVVSGDYYDFINLPDGNLGFCLGDVSGKGMPAALLMANLQAI